MTTLSIYLTHGSEWFSAVAVKKYLFLKSAMIAFKKIASLCMPKSKTNFWCWLNDAKSCFSNFSSNDSFAQVQVRLRNQNIHFHELECKSLFEYNWLNLCPSNPLSIAFDFFFINGFPYGKCIWQERSMCAVLLCNRSPR